MCVLHVIHACSERHSSTLSSPFHPTSSSPYQWNPRLTAGTPPTLLRRPVESSMGLFFKKPVIMSRTSLISSLHTLATRTSPSCPTRTPSSPTLWFSPSKKTPQAKVRGVWFYSSFEHCCAASIARTPTVTFCSVHIHYVVAKKRDASTELLQRLHGYKAAQPRLYWVRLQHECFIHSWRRVLGSKVFSTW